MGFRGRVRGGVCAAALVCLCGVGSGLPPKTHTAKAPAAASAWEQASKARAAFELQAAGTRTKAGYARVLEGFRAIYHGNPRDLHAAQAVNAVAELLAEQGREFDDAQSLRAAVGQYEFLRTQYPASSLRAGALLAEARIERDDLGDAGAARGKYQALLKESPRSDAGKTARVELAQSEGRGKSHPSEQRPLGGDAAREERRESVAASTVTPPAHRDEAAMNGAREGLGLVEIAKANSSAALRNDKQISGNDRPIAASVKPVEVAVVAPPVAGPAKAKTVAQVTGIRHWSTATYTRVAIDLGDEVKFEAARVPNPDRIYFDLHGARLAQELVGKSFDVTDDGFLKRIRAGQSTGDVTRVVLDVNDVTEYSAFLLPNPYRLIIDIHGKRAQGAGLRAQEIPADMEVPAAETIKASAAANVSGLPATAPTDGGEAVKPLMAVTSSEAHVSETRHGAPTATPAPAKPVPNTVAVAKPGTSSDVAALSDSPGRVEATSEPTSKPIVATVKPQTSGNTHFSREEAAPKTAHTAPVAAEAEPVKAAEKTAEGETSLIRALGLKINRIVIDAGHGGHDSGTIGVDGIQEKDVVLDVALRVGKMLHDRLGAEIIYTRSDDTFIPLETRTAIANKAQADLFLSIHANSSPDATARGVEVYYLNFTSDPTALDVAARENAVSGQSIHQLSDLVKKITLKDKIAESREFAADVEGNLFAGLTKGNAGLKDRGVKKAPFVVLIGANMPSILAEISFVTNAKDAEQLREPEYRQRVAESLFAGVAKYENGLAGARVAPAVKRAALQ